ncbi:hypothetical protein K9L97_01270 [Candidatus Woesearchaeota archaeon]|nr:hypothetical protein [Candidatus Woesearchaeota archaeon]
MIHTEYKNRIENILREDIGRKQAEEKRFETHGPILSKELSLDIYNKYYPEDETWQKVYLKNYENGWYSAMIMAMKRLVDTKIHKIVNTINPAEVEKFDMTNEDRNLINSINYKVEEEFKIQAMLTKIQYNVSLAEKESAILKETNNKIEKMCYYFCSLEEPSKDLLKLVKEKYVERYDKLEEILTSNEFSKAFQKLFYSDYLDQ